MTTEKQEMTGITDVSEEDIHVSSGSIGVCGTPSIRNTNREIGVFLRRD